MDTSATSPDRGAGPRAVTRTADVVAALTAFTPLRGQPGEPGWLPAVTAVALMADCGTCWAIPGSPCPIIGRGTHLAGFARVRRAGLIGAADLAAAANLAGHPRIVPAGR